MEKKYRSYIYKLGLISIVLLVGSLALFLTVLESWFNYIFPFVILYFFLFNSIQHFKLLKLSNADARIFHTNYMAWFGIKMFLNLSFVIIYALSNKKEAVSFIFFFAFCYVVYTTFEVIALSKALNSENIK